ncbi:MAG: hypothetical protein BroJett040_24440 [Oligoflexia bacterium]|nr:MAG: hypothetical protein BroJett040_24440 [Oligoflexia bacterium]
MRSEVRWSTQAHPATKIAELIVANELTSTLLRYNLKIPSYLAIAEKNLLILPTSGRQNFEIRSLQENRSLAQIQLSTLTSIPAVASANSNWVIFYSLINEKLRLQPVHLSNQTLIEVSPLKSTNSQLAPWVTENTLAWIEVDFRDLFLRTINLQTKNQALIKLDPSSLPLLNGQIEPDRLVLYTLNKQGLVRYDLNSSTHELSTVQTYSYPESLTRLTYFSHNQLTNLLSFEKGNKVIISLGNLGGLVSFDLIEKTWAQHGLIAPAYRCLNPSLQVENEL